MEFKEKTKEALNQADNLLLSEMMGYNWGSDERSSLWEIIIKIEHLIYSGFKS